MSFSAKLPFELSVLDFGIIAPGRSGREVLADSLELADRLDQLRYHRLWLSEHHEPHFCWTGPEGNRSHPPLSLQDTVINALFGL